MSIIEKLLSKFGYIKAELPARPPADWAGLSVRGRWDRAWLRGLEGLYEEEISLGAMEREPYRRYSWLQIAIYKKAKAMASCPFKIYEGEEEVTDGPVYELFRDVNPYMSRFQFFEALTIYYNLKGEFFVYFPPTVGQALGRGKIPTEMYVLEPQYMHPVKDDGGNLAAWVYRPPSGKNIPIELGDLIHLKRFNPYNQWRGLSPYDAARMGIRIDFKAAQYNEAFFDNNAMPDGFLVYPEELTEDQYKRIKKQWNDRYRGAKKAHQMGILEGGVDIKTLGLSHKEMEFLETRRFSREEILALYEVPKALLSITDDLNYATLQGLKKSFWHEVIIPFQRMVEDKFESEFFAARAPGLRGRFDRSNVLALQEDMSKKIEMAEKLWKMGFTADEINERLELGFDEAPWRKVWWAPLNLVPAGSQEGKEGGEKSTPPAQPAGPQETPKEACPPASGQDLSADGDDVPFPDSNFPTEEIRGRVWREFDTRVRPLEQRLEAKVRRYFYELRKRVLVALDKGTRAEKDVLAFVWDDEKKRLVEVAMPVIEDILERGIEMALELVNGDFTAEHPEAVAWLAQKELKIVGIVDTVKEQIREQILEGMEKGETIAQLAERVKKVFNMAATRARTIARTETGGAFNAGHEMTFRNEGVKKKEWLSAKDDHVRDHHRIDGEIVGINERFSNGLRYPGDPEGEASNIINCRCLLLPVIEK